jgi:hypothetical protein
MDQSNNHGVNVAQVSGQRPAGSGHRTQRAQAQHPAIPPVAFYDAVPGRPGHRRIHAQHAQSPPIAAMQE